MNVRAHELQKPNNAHGLRISEAASRPGSERKGLHLVFDLFWAGALLALLGASFSNTILEGKSVSRLALTPEWDSLFHAFRTGNSSLYDPSLIQLFAPQWFLVGKIFQQGYLPLWNPFSGFGSPLIGDIQATVFSPFRLLFNLNPSIQTWNQTLLIELAFCAVTTYALGRYLKLGRIASAFAAAIYTFCPFNFWYLELNIGTASCIYPLTFLLFARAARHRTRSASIIAGIGCALLIVAGHPESAFFGITMGSFFMMCMMLLDPTLTSGQISRLLNFRRGLTVTALATVALTAPVLFPFIEYLLNSETYKYASVCSAHVPWPGVLQHCLNASSGAASPFLGVVTAICIPLSFFAFRKKSTYRPEVVSVLITAVVAFLLVTQLGQLEQIFNQPPLTTIVTRYCYPVLLLMLPLLAAFGLSELFSLNKEDEAIEPASEKSSENSIAATTEVSSKGKDTNRNKIPPKLTVVLIASVFALGLPFLLKDCEQWLKLCSFDMMLPAPAFNSSGWKRDVVCALVLVGISAAAWVTRKRVPGSVFATLALIPAFVSVAAIAKGSLPPQPTFNYPVVEPITKLKDAQWRCAATGNHLFRPAVNAVYGVQDVQVHNPLFPKRYMSFIKACGAKVDMFNQEFDTEIHPLLGIASTKYLLSQLPIHFTGTATPAERLLISADTPLDFESQVTLRHLSIWSSDTAAGGSIKWQSSPSGSYSFALVLLDSKDQVLWFGDQQVISSEQGNHKFSIPVPPEAALDQNELKLAVQVYDRKTNRFLTAKNVPLVDSSAVVGAFAPANADLPAGAIHPQLIQEYAGHVRLYENPTAMPRAYVVYSHKTFTTEQQALEYMKSPVFSPAREVVLESDKSAIGPQEQVARDYTAARIDNKNPNQVEITVDAAAPGHLVLTDIFYPGWKAYVDGKETAIRRANYAFKAVEIGSGKHTVTFKYEPLSFFAGAACFFLFLAGACFAWFKGLIGNKRS